MRKIQGPSTLLSMHIYCTLNTNIAQNLNLQFFNEPYLFSAKHFHDGGFKDDLQTVIEWASEPSWKTCFLIVIFFYLFGVSRLPQHLKAWGNKSMIFLTVHCFDLGYHFGWILYWMASEVNSPYKIYLVYACNDSSHILQLHYAALFLVYWLWLMFVV